MKIKIICSLSLFTIVFLTVPVRSEPFPREYKIIDLGTLGGAESRAYGLNEFGQVVGSSQRSSDPPESFHAFFWNPNQGLFDMFPDDPNNSCATTITRFAKIGGWSQTVNHVYGFVWNEPYGSSQYVFNTPCDPNDIDYTDSLVFDIAEYERDRYIVGHAGFVQPGREISPEGDFQFYESCPGFYHNHDTSVWGSSSSTASGCLGTLGGNHGCARAVNDFGQIVGWSHTNDDTVQSFLWSEENGIENAGLTFNSCGWNHTDSEAYDINDYKFDKRIIVGRSGIIDRPGGIFDPNEYHHFITSFPVAVISDRDDFGGYHTIYYLLGSLGGTEGCAYGVNNNGKIVGYSTTAEGEDHAFVWSLPGGSESSDPNTWFIDLNDLLPPDSGWQCLRQARNINDWGQIVGWGETDTGQIHAFLMSPTPNLHLTDPNGGESLLAGSTYTINWQTRGMIDHVQIELWIVADDGSTHGISVDPNIPNTGSYEWVIPQITSQECMIRICDTDNCGVFDWSDDLFTIFECTLTADLIPNCVVDLNDFVALSSHWLESGVEDFTEDSIFELDDLMILAGEWLQTGNPFDSEWRP
jgi:probable HAF family extracellular repeat protein